MRPRYKWLCDTINIEFDTANMDTTAKTKTLVVMWYNYINIDTDKMDTIAKAKTQVVIWESTVMYMNIQRTWIQQDKSC